MRTKGKEEEETEKKKQREVGGRRRKRRQTKEEEKQETRWRSRRKEKGKYEDRRWRRVKLHAYVCYGTECSYGTGSILVLLPSHVLCQAEGEEMGVVTRV